MERAHRMLQLRVGGVRERKSHGGQRTRAIRVPQIRERRVHDLRQIRRDDRFLDIAVILLRRGVGIRIRRVCRDGRMRRRWGVRGARGAVAEDADRARAECCTCRDDRRRNRDTLPFRDRFAVLGDRRVELRIRQRNVAPFGDSPTFRRLRLHPAYPFLHSCRVFAHAFPRSIIRRPFGNNAVRTWHVHTSHTYGMTTYAKWWGFGTGSPPPPSVDHLPTMRASCALMVLFAVGEATELVGLDDLLVFASFLRSFGTFVRVDALPAGEVDRTHAAFREQTVD